MQSKLKGGVIFLSNLGVAIDITILLAGVLMIGLSLFWLVD